MTIERLLRSIDDYVRSFDETEAIGELEYLRECIAERIAALRECERRDDEA